MSETKKKRKYSFNAFDVFVILLILVLIGTVVYKISKKSSIDANKDNPVYTVIFDCTDEYDSLQKYLKDGDEVYIKSSGELFGYIYKSADSVVKDALYSSETETSGEADSTIVENGTEEAISESAVYYKKTDFEGKIKLNGNAEKSNEGEYYTVEGINITVGSVIDVYTDDAEFTIIIKGFIDGSKK